MERIWIHRKLGRTIPVQGKKKNISYSCLLNSNLFLTGEIKNWFSAPWELQDSKKENQEHFMSGFALWGITYWHQGDWVWKTKWIMERRGHIINTKIKVPCIEIVQTRDVNSLFRVQVSSYYHFVSLCNGSSGNLSGWLDWAAKDCKLWLYLKPFYKGKLTTSRWQKRLHWFWPERLGSEEWSQKSGREHRRGFPWCKLWKEKLVWSCTHWPGTPPAQEKIPLRGSAATISTCDTKITFFVQLSLEHLWFPLLIGLAASLTREKLLYKLKVHQGEVIQVWHTQITARATGSFFHKKSTRFLSSLFFSFQMS